MSEPRARRLFRVRHERALTAIIAGLVGATMVTVGLIAGDEAIVWPLDIVVLGLFPLLLVMLVRREFNRDVPRAAPLADHHRIETRETTTKRELLQTLPLLSLVGLVVVDIGEGLTFGLLMFVPVAAAIAWQAVWVANWERATNTLLYRERRFSGKARYVRRDQAATGLGPGTAASSK